MNEPNYIISNILAILGTISSVTLWLYYRNENVYLFVQRIILKFKSPSKTNIDVKLSLKSSEPFSLENLRVPHARHDIRKKRIIFDETGNIREYEYSISETNYREHEILISGKYPSYSCDYDKDFESIRAIHNAIKDEIQSKSSLIDFVLSFEGRNPYEGFFVKQLPGHQIENFAITLKLDDVKIEAKKNKIISRSKSVDHLIKQTLDLLTLKTPIIKAG